MVANSLEILRKSRGASKLSKVLAAICRLRQVGDVKFTLWFQFDVVQFASGFRNPREFTRKARVERFLNEASTKSHVILIKVDTNKKLAHVFAMNYGSSLNARNGWTVSELLKWFAMAGNFRNENPKFRLRSLQNFKKKIKVWSLFAQAGPQRCRRTFYMLNELTSRSMGTRVPGSWKEQ